MIINSKTSFQTTRAVPRASVGALKASLFLLATRGWLCYIFLGETRWNFMAFSGSKIKQICQGRKKEGKKEGIEKSSLYNGLIIRRIFDCSNPARGFCCFI
jgi:hypothetical protein